MKQMIKIENRNMQANEYNSNWPIAPDFLSIRAGVNKYDKGTHYSPNNHGLFTANELRGILADSSDAPGIDNILALFQVVPEEFICEICGDWFKVFDSPKSKIINSILMKPQKRKIIRIDPGKLYSNIRCCELFRKCTDDHGESCENKCLELDSRIALLFDEKLSEINNTNDTKEQERFYKRLDEIKEKYNEEIKSEEGSDYLLNIERYNNNTRLYVKYQCKYSKLMEYFFPIFHAGKVIAVLMQGQRFLSDLKPKDMFKEYRHGDKTRRDLNDYIEKDMKAQGRFYNSEEAMSETRIIAITKQIELFESRIRDTVTVNAQKYVSDKFFEIEGNFRKKINLKTDYFEYSDNALDKLRKKIKDLDQNLEDYKVTLNETLRHIFDSYNYHDPEGFIRIYAMETPLENMVNPNKDGFKKIGDSKSVTTSQAPKKIIFEKDLILAMIKDKKQNDEKQRTIEGESLLNCIAKKRHDELINAGLNIDKDIFRMEIPFASHVAYVIWEKYNQLDMKSEQYKVYESYLKLVYHTLLEPYFILRGMKSEKDLEISMRISGHESAQIVPPIIQLINDTKTLKTVDVDTGIKYSGDENVSLPARTIIDVSLRLNLLEELFKRSSLFFKNEKPTYNYHDFHRIIYATKSLFDEKAYSDNLQIIMPDMKDGEGNWLNKYNLKTDYKYLSHVLFNLMDNAIKHGLRGSKIHIKAKLDHEYSYEHKGALGKIVISVVSFGDKIKDREKVFELFYRSPKANVKDDGMGIGLFLAKKLCNILEYKLICRESKPVDEKYNLPFIFYCRKQKIDASSLLKSNIISDILKKEIKQEFRIDVINQNIQEWDITLDEIEPMFFLPTFRNVFEITIPIKENDLELIEIINE